MELGATQRRNLLVLEDNDGISPVGAVDGRRGDGSVHCSCKETCGTVTMRERKGDGISTL